MHVLLLDFATVALDHPAIPKGRPAMTDQGAMDAYRQAVQQQQSHRAIQNVYWQDAAKRKRAAPMPSMSQSTTPQEDPASASQDVGPALVLPWALQDHTATQATASAFGVDMNDESAVRSFLQRPVKTTEDVLQLVRGYHVKVVRPELYNAVLQLESALKTVGEQIFQTRSELSWLASENRQLQKNQSGVQIITSGWPQGLAPEYRLYMLTWMLSQVPKIKTFCESRGFVPPDHSADTEKELMKYLNVLTCEPVTIPQGEGFYSAMTVITFKSWETRSSFLEKWGGSGGVPLYTSPTTPQANRHIRVTPSSPQWQRKLEAPLRVLIACLNEHPDTANKNLVILWKTLTLMEPRDDRNFAPDMKAWARLFYHESNGDFVARLEMTQELYNILQTTPPSSMDSRDDTLWSACWNRVIWGSQYELDQAEAEVVAKARTESHGTGKGTMVGKGRRHWSSSMVHNNYYRPYPFSMDCPIVEQVAFCWNELCDKLNAPGEKVASYSIATYQGKPADAEGDLSQAAASFTDHTAQYKGKGGGKASSS